MILAEDKISNYLIEYQEMSYFKKLKQLKNLKIEYTDEFNPFKVDYNMNNGLEKNGNTQKINWKRINKNKYKIYSENYNKCKIKSQYNSLGNLDNCLNVLKERPELIRRLLEFDNFNDSGSNGIWLNVDNNWRLVLIDYYLPFVKIEKNGEVKEKMMYSKTSDKSIWNNIIEKGLAKSLGSYEEISKFSFENLFYQITGIMPNIVLLEKNVESFNFIKRSLNFNKIISCYKTSKHNNGKLKDEIVNNKQYIIFDYIKEDEKIGIKLKSCEELENYQSLDFKNEEKFYVNMSWEEFLEEFEYISVVNAENHYINNIKFDNNRHSILKLFIDQNNLFDFNIIQSSYDKDEINYGIQNWKHPEKEVLIDIESNKETENREDDINFIRSRISKENPNSFHSIKFFRIISEYKVDLVQEFYFDNNFNSKNIELSPGEYLVYVKSNWKNLDLLNSLSIQFNSQYSFDLQTINEDEEIINYFNRCLILNENEKSLSEEGNVIFSIDNYKIQMNEVKDNEEKIYIISTNSDKAIRIKFQADLKYNAKIFPDCNIDNEVFVEINNEKEGIIKLTNLDSSIKFKAMDYLDDEEFNIEGKLIYNFKKFKNDNKVFYLNNNIIEAGCNNCIIF